MTTSTPDPLPTPAAASPYASYFHSELLKIESRLHAYANACDGPIAMWLTFATCFLTSARTALDPNARTLHPDPLPAPPHPLMLETRLKWIEQHLRLLEKEYRVNVSERKDRPGPLAVTHRRVVMWISKASQWVATARELNEIVIESVSELGRGRERSQ